MAPKTKKKYPKIAISKTLFGQFTNSSQEISKAQARILRVDWPLQPGWQNDVIGKEISYPVRGMLLKLSKTK